MPKQLFMLKGPTLATALLIYLTPLAQKTAYKKNDGKIEFTFLQLNDVYEVSPLDKGRVGGLARVAAFREDLQKQNANTYTFIAGDFISPSAVGFIRVNDTSIAGMQMIDALNAVKIDLAVFGNHEFDWNNRLLNRAIDKSEFDWVSSNTYCCDSASGNKPFSKTKNGVTTPIPTVRKLSLKDKDGTSIKVGIFGLTINSNKARYVRYDSNYIQIAQQLVRELKKDCDLIVALTHLDREVDKAIAKAVPGISLIMGGHEHVNSYDTVGATRVAKADANAKTVYVHKFRYNKTTKRVQIMSELVNINYTMREDPLTRERVEKWNYIGQCGLEQMGFKPCEVIANVPEDLDGSSHNVRTGPTNLTQIIANTLTAAVDTTIDASIYNSGSIRVDDVILKGDITQHDVFRILPYGGQIFIVNIKGDVLKRLLDISKRSEDNGRFLQYEGIKDSANTWYIRGKEIDPDHIYTIAMTDYLAKGYQEGMEFLQTGVLKTHIPNKLKGLDSIDNDLQKALIKQFQRLYPAGPRAKNNLKIPCY